MNIRKQVRLEYETRNKDKCFAKECNNKIYKILPFHDIENSIVGVCRKHYKEDKIPVDMRKLLVFGFNK